MDYLEWLNTIWFNINYTNSNKLNKKKFLWLFSFLKYWKVNQGGLSSHQLKSFFYEFPCLYYFSLIYFGLLITAMQIPFDVSFSVFLYWYKLTEPFDLKIFHLLLYETLHSNQKEFFGFDSFVSTKIFLKWYWQL